MHTPCHGRKQQQAVSASTGFASTARTAVAAAALALFVLGHSAGCTTRSGHGGVSFAASSAAGFSDASAALTTRDDVAFVVSITRDGEDVYEHIELGVLEALNGHVTSDVLQLSPGDYLVTEFLVVQTDSDEVAYATPASGAPLAYLVDTPLPYAFSVSKDDVTQLSLEVLTTEQRDAADFGYAGFDFDIVETIDFVVAIFVYDEEAHKLALTNAELRVTGPTGEALYDGELLAEHNVVMVRSGHDTYTLEVSKSGYDRAIREVGGEELELYFERPISFVLTGTGFELIAQGSLGAGPVLDIDTFSSAGETYVALAPADRDACATVHRVSDDGTTADPVAFPRARATAWDHFSADGRLFLIAGGYSDPGGPCSEEGSSEARGTAETDEDEGTLVDPAENRENVAVFSWDVPETATANDGSEYASLVASVVVSGVTDVGHVVVGSQSRIVAASRTDNSAHIYDFVGSEGATMAIAQTLDASEPLTAEAFTMNGETFLVVGDTWAESSPLYRYEPDVAQFETVGSIPTQAPAHFEAFEHEGETWLCVANLLGGVSILNGLANGGSQVQELVVVGATDCTAFASSGRQYLAVASLDDWVIIFRWYGAQFVEVVRESVDGPVGIDTFAHGDADYLAIGSGAFESESGALLYRVSP